MILASEALKSPKSEHVVLSLGESISDALAKLLFLDMLPELLLLFLGSAIHHVCYVNPLVKRVHCARIWIRFKL